MYKPLPNSVTISQSSVHGLGLFSKEIILKDTNLGLTHIKNEDFEDGYIRTPLGGFFNHNPRDPNAKVEHIDDKIYLITIRDIDPGEEITVKYTLYDPEL